MSSSMTPTNEGYAGVPGSSRLKPVEKGKTVKTSIECGDRYSAPEIYNLEITLLEILRGEAARERLTQQEVLDGPAKTGFGCALVRARVACSRKARGSEGAPYRIREGQFAAISTDGKTEYPGLAVLRQPEPALVGVPLVPGQMREGWVALQTPVGEEALLIFKRERAESLYGIWGPIWFRLE